MSDDGYGGGGAGDDYDYGGPSLAEEVYVRPRKYYAFLSHISPRMKTMTCSQSPRNRKASMMVKETSLR
jgi:hypothetical protein